MRILRIFRAAFLIAMWQTIAAFVLAMTGAALIFVRSSDTSSSPRELAGAWLDMLYRLTVADVAVLFAIIAISIDAIRLHTEVIGRAVQAVNSKTPRATVERMIALSLGSIFACVAALFNAPVQILEFATRADMWSSLIFLWPTILTALLAFFSAVLIGALEVKRRQSL